nr:hypothetical protein [Tanacetum cinerariifolium]
HVKQKAKEDPFVQRYQVIKKRPQTEAQARKNMIMYLKNIAGFILDYFKGMSYDDIHPIFEAKFSSNIAFLLKTKEKLEEEENKTNDITRLQALVDKKKVVITEAVIRDVLRLNDAKELIAYPMKRFLLNWLAWVMRSHPQSSYSIRLSSQASGRKGFSRVETPLFEGMLVAGVLEEEGVAEEQVPDVAVDDPATHRADTTVQGDDEALDACTTLTRRVEHLEYDKVAQALEITKLKRRVKKLEKGNRVKVLKLRSLQKGRMIDDLDKDDATVLIDDKEEEVKDDQVQGKQAEIYKIDMDHASKVLSMQEDDPAEVQEVVDVITTAKLITEVVTAASKIVTAASTTISTIEPQVPAAAITTAAPVRVAATSTKRRKGVVIKDPEEESTTIIPADTKSKDKGKGIMKKQQVEMDEEYARKLHEELNKDIDWDVAIEHVKQKAKEDPFVQRYQVMKKRPQTKAQARKNMIMYLKNIAGFRLDYFKGMSYDDIRPIFEAKFSSNIAFLLKTKEKLEEEENRVKN